MAKYRDSLKRLALAAKTLPSLLFTGILEVFARVRLTFLRTNILSYALERIDDGEEN